MKKLGIYGAGGMGGEFLGHAEKIDGYKRRWEEVIFIDDMQPEGEFLEKRRIHFSTFKEMFNPDEIEITISLGEPKYRKLLGDRVHAAGFSLATMLDPEIIVPKRAILGEGVVLLGSLIVLGQQVFIGDNTLIQSFSAIGHETVIGRNCNISAFTMVSGNCVVGDNVFVGLHASIKEKITIGNNVIIGMQAPVMHNVPDNMIVFHAKSKMVLNDGNFNALTEKKADKEQG